MDLRADSKRRHQVVPCAFDSLLNRKRWCWTAQNSMTPR